VYNADASAVNDLKFSENEVNIYPNPTKDLLNIRLCNTNHGYLKLTMFDASGKVLISKTENASNSKEYRMDVSNLNVGLYLLKITSNEKTITKKINISN
jgi:hypothetical protein